MAVTTLLISIASFVLSLFALWHSSRQTRAAELAAKAASESERAMKMSERAWVFVDVAPIQGLSMITGPSSTTLLLRITCTNDGRSPAWIATIRARFVIEESLPETPQFSPNDVVCTGPHPLSPGGDPFTVPRCDLKAEGIAGLGNPTGEVSVVYGDVLYRDPFSDQRRTTFAFEKIPGHDVRFRRFEGHPSYNAQT